MGYKRRRGIRFIFCNTHKTHDGRENLTGLVSYLVNGGTGNFVEGGGGVWDGGVACVW